MNMKLIKKALLLEKIRITQHAKEQMVKRGYTHSDVISCIWGGELTEHQIFEGELRVLVEGKDMDDLPIVIVVGRDVKVNGNLALVSVFPPIKEKFIQVI